MHQGHIQGVLELESQLILNGAALAKDLWDCLNPTAEVCSIVPESCEFAVGNYVFALDIPLDWLMCVFSYIYGKLDRPFFAAQTDFG